DGDAKGLCLVGIQIHAELWNSCPQPGVERSNFRSLTSRLHEGLRHVRQAHELAVRSILQHQLESAGRAETENGRQAKAEDNRTLEPRDFRLDRPQARLLLEVQRVTSVTPFVQR